MNVQIVKRRTADKYAFDRTDEIVLEMEAGKAFQVETKDALTGLIGDDSDDPKVRPMTGEHMGKLRMAWPPLCNPVVGPVSGVGTLAGAMEREEYQMVQALTLQKVVGTEYPKERLFAAP